MKLATIDVGTNTALLLVAEWDGRGLTPLHDARRFVRLGEGVDATGRVGEAAMGRLREALRAYRAEAEAHDVERIIVGATSASRDAENRAELVEFVRRETGLDYEILSGEEEARWSFLAAIQPFSDLEGRCAVVDVGGGSTEIAVGDARTGEISHQVSLPVGSVRLTERFFSSQPPSPEEALQAAYLVDDLFVEAGLPYDRSMPFIGTAGTATSLALLHHGVSSWDELGEAPVVLAERAVHWWRERLIRLPFDDVLALDPDIMAGRADVFPTGVLILNEVLLSAGVASCRISPWGLRHGLALRHVRGA